MCVDELSGKGSVFLFFKSCCSMLRLPDGFFVFRLERPELFFAQDPVLVVLSAFCDPPAASFLLFHHLCDHKLIPFDRFLLKRDLFRRFQIFIHLKEHRKLHIHCFQDHFLQTVRVDRVI